MLHMKVKRVLRVLNTKGKYFSYLFNVVFMLDWMFTNFFCGNHFIMYVH